MIVDSHQHVWDLDRADYPWLDASLAPLDRTMDLGEILPAMRAAGVEGTVLVQAADNAEDTANLLRVADANAEVLGVVAWVPLDEPDRALGMLARLSADGRVVGVRTLLHARPDPAWVLRDDVAETLDLISARGMTFDYVTGGPAALVHLPALSERHPQLSIVIDHLGKPPIGGTGTQRSEWRALLAAAAENPRITAKVSGLYAATGDLARWTVDGVQPFVDDALDLFGADRLMVGSDWPISVLAGGYDRTWSALEHFAGRLSVGERDALLGGTAVEVYGLRSPRG